jgi:putative membrane protein
MWGMPWLWWIFWVALARLLIWTLVSAVRDNGSDDGPPFQGRESAEEVLRRRFADGEIDEEEYQERLRVLRDEGGKDSWPGLASTVTSVPQRVELPQFDGDADAWTPPSTKHRPRGADLPARHY